MIDKKLDILRHALGLNYSKTSDRNRFVTGEGSTDYETCQELVEEGLMKRFGPNELFGGDYCYVVTDAGKLEAMRT